MDHGINAQMCGKFYEKYSKFDSGKILLLPYPELGQRIT
jgi:hypothetical protein